MPNLRAVIGANFGDEGKGLMTDYLSQGEHSLVVRFNGGAQAGHTVMRNGHRHIFHHFGSGTLNGSPTFLSKHFLVSPLAFSDELQELRGRKTDVYVDFQARVSTPWDMMLNQALERKRGDGKHGSCGLGIHETVVRSAVERLTVGDLFAGKYAETLYRIQKEYLPERAKNLGLDLRKDMPLWDNPSIYRHFLDDIHKFVETAIATAWSPAFVNKFRTIIFEGAQGLRLDEESSYFPNVTCSKTGLHNVAEMVLDAGLAKETLDVFYVTRWYVTRHGAGPLPHQLPGKPSVKVEDKTNVPNAWQDSIRYGLHDLQEFATFVTADWRSMQGVRINPHLMVTCADQVKEDRIVEWYDAGERKQGLFGELAHALTRAAGLSETWYSDGPIGSESVSML